MFEQLKKAPHWYCCTSNLPIYSDNHHWNITLPQESWPTSSRLQLHHYRSPFMAGNILLAVKCKKFSLQFLYLLCALTEDWMIQVTQVTVEWHQILWGCLISAQHLSFLQTPFSGVCLTPGDCSPPLALSSLDVCLDQSVKLVEKEDRTKHKRVNNKAKG